MTAQIVPFGGYQLCSCGQGVAVVLVAGGIICTDCAAALASKQVARADIHLIEPESPAESTSLDSILATLTKAAP